MGNSQGNNRKLTRRHTVTGDPPETDALAAKSAESSPSHQHPEFLVKLAKILVTRCIEEENLDGITEGIFQRYLFPRLKLLAKKLFTYLKEQNGGAKADAYYVTKESFLNSSEGLFQFVREDQQIELYTKAFADGKTKITEEELKNFLIVAFLTTGLDQASGVPPNLELILNSVLKSMHAEPGEIFLPGKKLHAKTEVTVMWVQNWIQKNTPYLLVSLHQLVMQRLTSTYTVLAKEGCRSSDDDYYSKLPRSILSIPGVDGDDPYFDPALMWLLSSSLPLLYIKKTDPSPSDILSSCSKLNPRVIVAQMVSASECSHWYKLYDSNVDGLSMTRLKTELLTYRGPTVMFIKSEIEHELCVAADVEWKDGHRYFGEDNCRLILIHPNYQIIEAGAKMLYFNLSTRGYPFGIHVGQDFRKPSVTIDQNLNIIQYKSIPSKLQEIRIFGCGRSDIKESQEKQKKWEKKQAEKARVINLNQCDWSENPDRYLLELASSRQSYSQYIS